MPRKESNELRTDVGGTLVANSALAVSSSEKAMNRGLVSVAAGALLLALGTPSFGQDDRDDLPDGADLLGSDTAACDGPLMIESDEDDDDDVRRIPRDETRLLRVDNPNVSWVCLGENGTRSDTMECPAETTHVLIERRGDGGETTFECYGGGR